MESVKIIEILYKKILYKVPRCKDNLLHFFSFQRKSYILKIVHVSGKPLSGMRVKASLSAPHTPFHQILFPTPAELMIGAFEF